MNRVASLKTHRLPETAFTALAAGRGDPAVIRLLQGTQQSKHTMLLHAIAGAVGDGDPADRSVAAFQAGYELLTRIQAADPGGATWLLGLPHLGGWANDALIRLDQGTSPDFAYLACAAAAAAVRAGVPFELDAPVRDGHVLLPGLGRWSAGDQPTWVRLRYDGRQLAAGDDVAVSRLVLGPDYGSGRPVPHWRGTPAVRVLADGLAWDVLLVTDDPYLDRYTLPMSAGLSATSCGGGGSASRPPGRCWSATTLGRRADSGRGLGHRPADPAVGNRPDQRDQPGRFRRRRDVLATRPGDHGGNARPRVPARQAVRPAGHGAAGRIRRGEGLRPVAAGSRPAGGLLQGIYAHLGIVRFWQRERQAETDPDDILRAQVQFARWRPAIEAAVDTLQRTGYLTAEGVRFAGLLRPRNGPSRRAGTRPSPPDRQGSCPGPLADLADPACGDRRGGRAELADAYRRGEQPSRHRTAPGPGSRKTSASSAQACGAAC